MVTNNSDTGVLGDGSLRGEIAAASSGDRIVFAPKVYGKTITLTKGELPIGNSLNIVGPGANLLTISGNDATRIFDIASGNNVTISGLTITHGRYDTTALGGGILTYGGGGILNQPGASLTLINDTLSNNQAVEEPALTIVNGQDEFGGGLFNLGRATINGCTFTNNESLGGGDTNSNIGGSAGGAIDNYDGASLTITGSLFSKNQVISADQPVGGAYFALGGAIENNAGTGEFGDNTPSTATLTDCVVLNSLAQGGAQALANGGAICNEGGGTQMTLTDCVISGNVGQGGVAGENESLGGGIDNLATMTIIGCAITNNISAAGTGAELTQTNVGSGMSNYVGSGWGGGIYTGGSLTITSSIISGNIARGAATATGPGGDGIGGGIGIGSGATVMVTNSLISNNLAIAGPGGAGGPLGTNTAAGFAFGGGIGMTGQNANVTVISSAIVGNVAQGSAGTNGIMGGDGIGGGVGVGFSTLRGGVSKTLSWNLNITLTSCTVLGNLALGGAGAPGANGGDGLGGGLAIASAPQVNGSGSAVSPNSATLIASSVVFNAALGGEEGRGGSDGNGVGGGVYVFAPFNVTQQWGVFTFDVTDVIKDNFASTSNNDIFP